MLLCPGFCGSVAQNPQDKSSRYGGKNKPWKDTNPTKFSFGDTYGKSTGGLNQSRKEGDVQIREKEREHVNAAVYLHLLRCFRCHVFYSPLPSIRSQRNKDGLINSRMGANVAKLSQTPTKVNAMPQSKKKAEKRRRDGGGEKIWGSNASLMRLLVVSAVGAWHWHAVVSQPTKICSACCISAALFCLRPTHTRTKHTVTHTALHTHY